MGKLLISKIFIKSAITQKNLKFCMMIIWTMRLFKKISEKRQK